MTSRFFRFLSKRGNKSSTSNSNKIITNQINQNNQNEVNTSTTKHVKLNVCEDLKESIEHYNQRCLEIKKLKEKQEIEQKINNLQQPVQQQQQHNSFFNFKSFKNKNKSSSTINNQLQNLNQSQQPSKDTIECAIVFLDDTQESFYLPKKSLASKLYEQVFYHLDLIETDYFGLQFSDTHNVKHWLDPTKPIKKQCKIGPPYQFFFKVKFYTAEPNNLKEELTRYFYFLQLKQDLKLGQLTCTFQEQICVELCALILQEELGDYDPQNHFIETISEFRFLPDYQQTEDFEEKIFEKFSTSSSYKGMTPAEAELTFLNKAKWLEMYGVDMHSVYGRDQNEYKLGLTPSGILVFEETIQNHQNSPNQPPIIYNKIGLFYWPKIEKVTFSKKKFTILVAEDDNNGFKQEHTFIFNLIDEKACKHLWKCAVEYHAFFRLRTSPRQLMLLNSSSTNGLFNGFIRRGSRFRGPERTEFQTHNLSRLTTPRRSVQFERRPSQRFSRRASYAMKRKLQEQQKNTQVQIPEPKPRNSGQNALVPSLSDTKLNNDTVNNPTTASTSQVNVNCSKLPQTSNGIEHDQKCDLYKAQLTRQQNENIVCKSGSSSSKCSSAESTCSESSSSAVISSSSNEKIVDDEDSGVISPKSVKNKKLVDESVLSNETNKIENKELLLSKSKDASVISNMSNIATVPGSDIRSRPRSNNVKISHINALNNINATAFTINNVNRITINQKANERPPLVINNLNNINTNKQPIMTEL